MSTHKTIEDLLLETLDAVSRSRVARKEAIAAALDAGALLTQAKARLPHGSWADWLERVGLAPRTASTWMRLAAMELTATDVIERGGINATLRGRKSATLPIPSDRQRALAEAEAAVQPAKRAYYDALNAWHRALRALAAQEKGTA